MMDLAEGGGAASHVPVPHFPVRHAAVRPQRATAAAASWPRSHGPGSTRRKAGSTGSSRGDGGSRSRSAPHPPPRNRKWLHAAANSWPGRHPGAVPAPATAAARRKPRRPRGDRAGAGWRVGSLGAADQSGGAGGGPRAAAWPVTGESKGARGCRRASAGAREPGTRWEVQVGSQERLGGSMVHTEEEAGPRDRLQ